MIAPAITKPLAAPVQRDYVSWSAISTYQQCPLRYFFRYVEGLEETFTSASLALGGAVHRAVEHHFNELMVGHPAPDHDTLLNVFWDAWRSRAETAAIQLGKGEDIDAIGKTADRVITAFRASEFAQPQGRILGVEEELRSPLIPGLSACHADSEQAHSPAGKNQESMHITIHRGTHEIGGNCIEIATDHSRIILDIGMPLFNQDREPHDTGALRRQTTDQLRQSGVLPNVPGLFDGSNSHPDAILLSHAHEDHAGLLGHSHPDIPIYASVGTSKMMLAGAKFAGQPMLPRERQRDLTSGQPVQIGEFTITPFSVDHSIYGGQAFLIEAAGKTVLYSGDLRMHGRKPSMHRALVEAVHSRNIDLLLMEGTHIGHPDHMGPNEYDLEGQIAESIQSAPGLVLASFSPQHVDRLVGFLRATMKANRTFVADAYTAFVMHLIASETTIPRPESTGWVKVFFPKFFEESYRRKQLENHFVLMSPARIGMNEIRANPSRYVMLFRPSMLDSDFGGSMPECTRCLYSRWEGYLERPDSQAVTLALENSGGDVIKVHTSGHIYGNDIGDLIQQIKAKLVIPIHTFEPERFQTIASNVRVLKDGETLVIG